MKNRLLILGCFVALSGCSNSDSGGLARALDQEPPVISALATADIEANVSSAPIAFKVSDALTDPGSMSVQVASTNTALIAESGIAINRDADNYTLVLTPTSEMTGASTLVITATDGGGNVTTSTLEVTVGERMILDVDLVAEIVALEAGAMPVALNAVTVEETVDAGVSFDAIVEMN